MRRASKKHIRKGSGSPIRMNPLRKISLRVITRRNIVPHQAMVPGAIGALTTGEPTAAATVRISAAAADADVLAAAAMAGDAADAVSATAVAATSLLQSTLLRKARTVVPTAAQIGEMIAVIRTADLVATSTIVVPRARAPVLRQNPRKSRLCSLVNRWRNIVAGQLT